MHWPIAWTAEGLSIGFITYSLLKAFQGKGREVPLATWIIAGWVGLLCSLNRPD